MILGMVFVAINFVLMAQGWDSVQIGPWTLSGFWLLAAMIAIGGFGMGMASPASNNAAIDQAPDRAASITGIRGMFRLAGGTISISCVVLALSFFSDQAAGLDRIFVVFTCMLVVILPIVLLIPEPSRAQSRTAPQPQAQPRLRLVASTAREEARTRSSRVSPGTRST
jgi:MFS family permease